MAGTLTRRALFDRFRGGPVSLRPPWVIGEASFSERCDGCGDCIGACPSGLLIAGRGRLPVVDFAKSHCTFCGACADACRKNCFVPDRVAVRPWSLVARVSAACIEPKGVACRLCEAACDVTAIRFRPQIGGGSSIAISEACTGCGACLATCPVGALAIVDTQSEEIAA